MFQFKEPVLQDRKWAQPILAASGNFGCENAFGTLYLWSHAYYTKICNYKGFLLRHSGRQTPIYGFPIGIGNPKQVIEELIAFTREQGEPFHMWGLTQDDVHELDADMPGRFTFKPDRANADYIYSTQDMIQLAGRKYHGKRNHIAQFERNYSWTYEDITAENIPDCLLVAEQWKQDNSDVDGVEEEEIAIKKAFASFDVLCFQGGLIRVDGNPVAFTVGEEINPRLYVLHFEKALNGYNGLYPAINHAFAQHQLEPYVYVNREEDMGIEGLRKAKLSYHPVILLEKYLAELR